MIVHLHLFHTIYFCILFLLVVEAEVLGQKANNEKLLAAKESSTTPPSPDSILDVSNWIKSYSSNEKRYYYTNKFTRSSTWTEPTELQQDTKQDSRYYISSNDNTNIKIHFMTCFLSFVFKILNYLLQLLDRFQAQIESSKLQCNLSIGKILYSTLLW